MACTGSGSWRSLINIIMCVHVVEKVWWEGEEREEGGWECMCTILCTKWCIMNIFMLWCCVVSVHISSADINTMCVLLMLCLQIASHSQPPHPLPHLLAPTPPHKNLVSKALHSQCWTHITCDTKQWVHVLAILSATSIVHVCLSVP